MLLILSIGLQPPTTIPCQCPFLYAPTNPPYAPSPHRNQSGNQWNAYNRVSPWPHFVAFLVCAFGCSFFFFTKRHIPLLHFRALPEFRFLRRYATLQARFPHNQNPCPSVHPFEKYWNPVFAIRLWTLHLFALLLVVFQWTPIAILRIPWPRVGSMPLAPDFQNISKSYIFCRQLTYSRIPTFRFLPLFLYNLNHSLPFFVFVVYYFPQIRKHTLYDCWLNRVYPQSLNAQFQIFLWANHVYPCLCFVFSHFYKLYSR